MTKQIIFFLVLIGSLWMCKTEAILDDLEQNLWDCHHKNIWDKASTEKALLGKWSWKQTICTRTTSGKIVDKTSLLGTEILIEKEGKLVEFSNGVKIKEYSWSLDKKDGDLYGLTVTPFLEVTHGRILICEALGQVDFGNSYLDGCDYRFKKVD